MKHILLVIAFLFYLFQTANGQSGRGLTINSNTNLNLIPSDSTIALIVGVSEYEFIQPLQYAHTDALAFYQFLTSKNGADVPETKVKLLLNKDATRNSILNNIYTFLAKNAKQAKRIIIYFSGHGDADEMGEQFLLASKCNPSNDVNNYAATDAVSISEIKSKIKFFLGSGVEVLLLMDACRTSQLLHSSKNNLFDINANLEDVNGEMLFLSCEKGQVSQEGAQWGNGRGLFSFHLINGLQGKADRDNDGIITLDEIKRFTDNAVYNDPNNKSSQTPVFRHSQNSTYKIFPAGKPETIIASIETVPSGVAHRNVIKTANKETAYSELTKMYQCIGSGKLLSPTDDCAFFYLEQLKKIKAKAEIINSAQNTLGIELLDSCVRILNAYISGIDNLGNYKYRLGNLFINGGLMFDQAKQLLASVNPEITEVNKSMGLFFKARGILEIEPKEEKLKRLPEALQVVNEALLLKPGAAYLHHLKSLIYTAGGQVNEAITSENQAIKLAPNWIYPYNTLAGLYFNNRQYGEALKYYNKALDVDSNSFLPYVGLGNTLKRQGNFNQALKYYNLSIQKDSLNTAGFYNRGFFYIHRNEAEKGKKDFEHCLRIDSRFFDAYLGLAIYYESKGKYSEAIKQYAQASSIDKSALEEIISSANSLELLGKTSEATFYREQYGLLKAK